MIVSDDLSNSVLLEAFSCPSGCEVVLQGGLALLARG